MTLFRKSKSKGDLQQEFQTTVRFLDDSEPIQLQFTKDTNGQFVLDKVCESLNLVEKDYFGLRFVDGEKQRHWLDPTKTVYKQLKGVSPCVLCFRVKFYPADPMKLHEEITRYYLFLQLRRDLHHGRLLCSPQDANLLAAYIIQSEVGDYDPQDHPPGYVAEFKMLPNQNDEQEQQIQELHKTLVGQVPAEAEGNFLKKAASLDTFGVDPHKVKDQKGNQMYLGVTHQGIMTFHGSRRTQIYNWSQIKKLAFEGKTFIIHVNINEDPQVTSKKKHQPIGYKCFTVAACKYLWKCAVEQQFFFTLNTSSNIGKVRSGGSLFSRGSKFRFSGRCQNEAYIASEEINRKEPDFQRTCSLPNFARRSDSRLNARNSATLSHSITEDKGGQRYKASTLPHKTSIPSVSVEPSYSQPVRKNSRGSGERRRSSSKDREEKRQSSRERKSSIDTPRERKSSIDTPRERKSSIDTPRERKSSIDTPRERKSSIETPRERKRSIETPRERKSSMDEVKEKGRESKREPKPRLKDVARQSSVYDELPIEVEQRQMVVADERPIVAEFKTDTKTVRPVEVVLAQPDVTQTTENAVDVPRTTCEVPKSPPSLTPVFLDEEAIVAEEMTKVQSSQVKSTKQNGSIPVIITSPAEDFTTPINSSLLYEPDETVLEQDDEKNAKSLEEQVMELEKEYERMQQVNHMEDTEKPTKVDQTEPITPVSTVKPSVAPPKKGGSCGKILAFTFFSLFVTLTVTACVVMFSDIQHPVMRQVRSQLTFLEPIRDFILDKYNGFVNKS